MVEGNEGRIFFSEENKQKTFDSLSRVYPATSEQLLP